MPPHPQPQGPAPCWYVILPGAGPAPPWPKDRDRFVFLAALRRALDRHGAGCTGFCLLPGSAQLLLEAAPETLRQAVAEACRGYGRYWRGWYAGPRRVFRPPRATAAPPDLRWDALAHLETEPVRAGLAEAAENYRWSSAAAHTGWAQPYLRLDEWSACWSCRQWHERLSGWGSDLRSMKAVLRLVESARPFRALAPPGAGLCPGPLFQAPVRAARAAAGWI